MIDRLICLVLTLPVSTATTERIFSAMKHVKTVLRNKIEEEFLADSMMIYIERKLVEDIGLDSIIVNVILQNIEGCNFDNIIYFYFYFEFYVL